MSDLILRFEEGYVEAAQLERLIVQNDRVSGSQIIMRRALRDHFSIAALQDLSLLDTCDLYIAWLKSL